MGEEEKKPAGEEKKMEEKKGDEKEKKPEEKKTEKAEGGGGDDKKGDDSKEETPPPPPPPPPQEVVLKVYMHCEGCARKVRKSLMGFEGVEDVITDCKSSKVVVKGEKAAADPLKVLNRVQRKSHRQVQLISPIPKPPSEEEKAEKDEKPKPEEKKEEPPQIVTVVLKVYMHCEACAMQIKKRIQRIKGVESAEPDLKSSEVTVKGVFEAQKLVDYLYKRTGKQAVIVKQEPEKKAEGGDQEADKESKDEKKAEEAEKQGKPSEGDNGGGGGDNKEEKKGSEEAKPSEETEEAKVVELKRYEYYYNYPPSYAMEMYAYPQIFSDENPNACSVM